MWSVTRLVQSHTRLVQFTEYRLIWSVTRLVQSHTTLVQSEQKRNKIMQLAATSPFCQLSQSVVFHTDQDFLGSKTEISKTVLLFIVMSDRHVFQLSENWARTVQAQHGVGPAVTVAPFTILDLFVWVAIGQSENQSSDFCVQIKIITHHDLKNKTYVTFRTA